MRYALPIVWLVVASGVQAQSLERQVLASAGTYSYQAGNDFTSVDTIDTRPRSQRGRAYHASVTRTEAGMVHVNTARVPNAGDGR
jgi:hypothetical protein